jgi:hypothetical protein
LSHHRGHRNHREKTILSPLCSHVSSVVKVLEVGVYTLVFKGTYLLFFITYFQEQGTDCRSLERTYTNEASITREFI